MELNGFQNHFKLNRHKLLEEKSDKGCNKDIIDHGNEGFSDKQTFPSEKPYDSLREALKKSIRQMRDEGLVKPDMFVDKPVQPEPFAARVRELLGE